MYEILRIKINPGGIVLKKIKYWLLMGVVVAGLAACGDAEETDTDSTNSTPTESTESNDSATSDVSEGEKVVNASCIGCHGGDLSGAMGPNLTNLSLSKDEIINILENGKGSMPAGTAAGEEEAVADYLLSIQ
ncbi:cytochrome c [Solibacillus sp. Sa1YVA6]|uniref:Cytochrome c n=1 Tax=Solibacillus merdavium TaxID=2762218 RepID=A0ABR8XL17_9BACL|nr:cytochrome c [Solibacillus merdavium]